MIDVQSMEIESKFNIDSVGITNLRYPILVRDGLNSEDPQQHSAKWRMGVSLSRAERGTHMSRFIEELNKIHNKPLDLDVFFDFARQIQNRLGAEYAQISAKFPWFREVAAPLSKIPGFLDYTVTFMAQTGRKDIKTLCIEVPATAVCPCSKAISQRGAHNQRATIGVKLHLKPEHQCPSINKIIELIESKASSPIYPLLKRQDEKFVTESAYDNPNFVEDLARRVAHDLFDLPSLLQFEVKVVNQESIHNHDCYAKISFKR